MDQTVIPVLVVGAGPVGLTLANLLQQHGVDCRIITHEEEVRPVEQSRAEGNHARTLALYERLGVLEDVLTQGRPLHGATLHSHGQAVLGRLFLDDPRSYYPGATVLGQANVERLLESRLIQHAPARAVERGKALVSLEQSESEVRALLRCSDGSEEQVTARYLVGCDGAHSVARKQVGATFAGDRSDIQYALADVHVDFVGEELSDDLHLWLSPMMILARLEGGTWKAAAPTDASKPLPDTAEAVLSAIQERMDANGVQVRLHSPRWTSMFRISTRRVDTMRRGRVFLAGDAAHVHSPMGGQGMNEGMQDALNLAWKIALALQNAAPDALLDSYDAERAPIIAQVLKDASTMTHVLELPASPLSRLRDVVLSAALHLKALRPVIREQFAGAARNVRHSKMASDLDKARFPTASPHAGDRAPDADGLFADDVPRSRRLYALWAETHLHELLLFGGASETVSSRSRLAAQAAELEARYAGRLRARVVTPSGEGTGVFWRDSRNEAHARYGARMPCLYLVRPDGFIAFRAAVIDTSALRDFFLRVYGWNGGG